MNPKQAERLDAADTIFFERELEQKKAKAYEKRYPEFKGRLFVPVVMEYDPGVEAIVYEMLDQLGMAKIISNYAKDLPRADVRGEEVISKVKSLGASFGYTVQDIRRARLANKPLEQRKANACRRAILQKDDDIIAFGDADHGLVGFLNHPNIPDISAVDIGAGVTEWESKTPIQILADLNLMESTVIETTKGVESPDTLILPITSFVIVSQTPMSDVTDVTILEFFLKNSRNIRNVDSWYHLEAAGAGQTKRAVAYKRDPDYIEHPVPQDHEHPVPPQIEGLEYVQPAHARVGGVIVRYPLSAVFMDGI